MGRPKKANSLKTGRPKKYTPAVLKKIIAKLVAYIKSEEIPIIAEFAYKNNFGRQMLYEHIELSDTIKKLISKKEANLEKLALVGAINPTMAIFSLKQLGWSDRHDMNINKTEHKTIKINVYKEDTENEKLARVAAILEQVGIFTAPTGSIGADSEN